MYIENLTKIKISEGIELYKYLNIAIKNRSICNNN